MPTLPLKATRIPAPDASREDYVARALEMNTNPAPFNVTGHPAMTVPCAVSQGLPIGMMLVGRTGEDATALRAGVRTASRRPRCVRAPAALCAPALRSGAAWHRGLA